MDCMAARIVIMVEFHNAGSDGIIDIHFDTTSVLQRYLKCSAQHVRTYTACKIMAYKPRCR